MPRSMGKLHGVPDLPPHYLARKADLAGLKQKLLAGGTNVGTTGQSSPVGVQGMGGIGKSVLAAALAHDSEVRQAFPDGIYWLTIGQKPKLLELQNRLLRQLTGSKQTLTTEQEAKDALREALEGRTVLVVVDDAWTINDVNAFSVAAPAARLLVTTRNREVVVGLGAEDYCLDVLSPVQALRMLAECVGEKSPDKLPPEGAQVAKECGYLPLALAMISAMIQLMPPAKAWPDALARLERADLEKIKQISGDSSGYLYPNLLRAIEASIDALESVDQERYLDLAVFPEDQAIPEGPLAILWKLEEMDTRDCMTHFVARSLATWATDGSSLILHDLQRDLIHKRREKDLLGLHLRLVEVWDALPKLPDAYAWRWVAYHLVRAGRNEDLRRLLMDFGYLQAKLGTTDVNALIADYDYLPEHKDLRTVQSVLRQSAHILAGSPRELPSQLIGRLPVGLTPDIDALLKEASEYKGFPWLRPFGPSLTPLAASLVRTLQGHTDGVNAVAVTPDGRHAVSGSDDFTLRIWDLETGETTKTLQGHTDSVTAMVITPDGHHLVSGSRDHTLRTWDLKTGEKRRTLEGHTSECTALAVTPDGRFAVSGSKDYTLRVWDLETGKTTKTLQGHTGTVTVLVVTPDGRHVLSGSEDCTLRVWDLESGKITKTLQGHTGTVVALAITPDGGRVVSGSDDFTMQVWDLETGTAKGALHTFGGTALAMTSDGRHVVSCSGDLAIQVWDLKTEATRRTLRGHIGEVRALAVTPDDRYVVSGGSTARCEFGICKRGNPSRRPKAI
jgi:WD40 repeat protein